MGCSIKHSYLKSVFAKHTGHSCVLQKCKEVTWGDTVCRFYLSDGARSKIADKPVVTGSKTRLWSLGSYMHACNMYICLLDKTLLHLCRFGLYTKYMFVSIIVKASYYAIVHVPLAGGTFDHKGV